MILDEEGAFENEYRQKFGTLPRFPRRQRRPGKSTGLSMLLNPDKEGYFCTNTDSVGFMVVLMYAIFYLIINRFGCFQAVAHLPFDFPNVADKGIAIKPNTETYLKIEPEIVRAGSEIQAFPLVRMKNWISIFEFFRPKLQFLFYRITAIVTLEKNTPSNTINTTQCLIAKMSVLQI